MKVFIKYGVMMKKLLLIATLLAVSAGMNAKEINKRGEDLRGVYFGYEDLSRSNFSGSDLRGTKFCEVNLRFVDFSGADLRGAYFEKVNLKGVNFKGANLAGAKFKDCKGLSVWQKIKYGIIFSK